MKALANEHKKCEGVSQMGKLSLVAILQRGKGKKTRDQKIGKKKKERGQYFP